MGRKTFRLDQTPPVSHPVRTRLRGSWIVRWSAAGGGHTDYLAPEHAQFLDGEVRWERDPFHGFR